MVRPIPKDRSPGEGQLSLFPPDPDENRNMRPIMYGDQVLRDPNCGTCIAVMSGKGLAPYHDASEKCESGKRTHCSCDICF